jgi:hypothetical protein
MKKIFTLIATALVAMGASAQGTYAVMDGDAEATAGSTVTSVPNITMTWGVTGGANFKGGNKKSEVLKDILGSTAYCEGNGENGALTSGTVYYFEPTQAGTVTVGFVLNANKPFFVQDADGADVAFTCTNAEGAPVTFTDGKLAEKLTGGLATFSVAVGKKYAVYCTGSKLGFYGFKFELGGGDEPGGGSGSGTGEKESWSPIVDGALAPVFTSATPDANGNLVVDIQATTNVKLTVVSSRNPGETATSGLDNTNWDTWTDASFSYDAGPNDLQDGATFPTLRGSGTPAISFVGKQKYTEGEPQGVYHPNFNDGVDGGPNGWNYYNPEAPAIPFNGLYYKFTPSANGKLKVGLWVNKGTRYTYVASEAADKSVANVNYTAEGYINGQNIEVEGANKKKFLSSEEIAALSPTPYLIGAGNQPAWVYVIFDVEAGKSYYCFNHSSQAGFNGFEFTPGGDPSGVETIKVEKVWNADAPMYNLSGQKVDKNYKGIVIQNGRKFFNK